MVGVDLVKVMQWRPPECRRSPTRQILESSFCTDSKDLEDKFSPGYVLGGTWVSRLLLTWPVGAGREVARF